MEKSPLEKLLAGELYEQEPNMSVGTPAQIPMVSTNAPAPQAAPVAPAPKSGLQDPGLRQAEAALANLPVDTTEPPKPESQLERLERLAQEMQASRNKELEDANRRQMYQDMLAGVNSNLGLIVGGAQAMNTKAAVQAPKAGEIKQRDLVKEVSDRYKGDQEAMMEKYKALLKAQEDATSNAITPYQKAMLELNKDRLALDAKQFMDAETRRKGEAEDKKIQGISDRVQKSGLTSLSGQIDEIESDLGMSIEEAIQKGLDVPGFGRGASFVPDWMTDEQARKFRQTVQNIQNIQISKQFGATQTAGEVGRFNREFGSGKLESDKSLLNALSAIKRKYNEDINNIYSGADEKAVEQFSTRSGIQKKPTEKSQLSAQDKQALDWANNNPNDPRAEKIKKKLGY
jgi:hypothetical protein